MTDIFEEVDDALRQEKLLKFWEEYKNTIIAAIIILIVSTASTTGYKSWNSDRNKTETQKLSMALEAEDPITALKEFIPNTRSKHRALAQLSLASVHLNKNATEDALKVYQNIIDRRSTPKDLRDQARVLFSQHSSETDIKILKPILVNKKSPWVWHARIEAATILADQGNYTQALEHLKPFKDVSTIPLSLKQRGNALAHIYKIEQKAALKEKNQEKK